MSSGDVRGDREAGAGEVARPAARRRFDRPIVELEREFERVAALAWHRLHEVPGRPDVIACRMSVVGERTGGSQASGAQGKCSEKSTSVSVEHGPAPCYDEMKGISRAKEPARLTLSPRDI